MKIPDFSQAFIPGQKSSYGWGDAVLRPYAMGELVLVSSTTRANLITGTRDGFLGSYFGYDADNNIVSVIAPLHNRDLPE